MTLTLRYGDNVVSWGLPVSAMNVQSGREIEYKFSKYDLIDLPANVLDKWYKADIYKLNVFAERFEHLEEHEKACFKSVLMRNPDSSIDDMIAMTYGIAGVPVYPASTYAEIGEIAVDNEMLPEIEKCPDEVIGLLDYKKSASYLLKGITVYLLTGIIVCLTAMKNLIYR